MEDVSSCSSDGEEKALGVEEGDREITENESAAPRQAEGCVVGVGVGARTPVLLFSPDLVQKLGGLLTKPLHSPHRLTFKFGKNECKIVRTTLLVHGFSEVPETSRQFNVYWSTANIAKPHLLRFLLPYQKVNHFPRSYELTRKDRLCHNVQRMQQSKGMKHFNIIPKSFVIPEDMKQFLTTFRKQQGTWIVKPIASSRGRGIYLINHPNQLPREEPVVVSRYIENPLCIDGFKFDMRLYVAVTSYTPLRVYLFEEGLARFATVQYAGGGEELHNCCMHLTNYSLNKSSANYVRCDDPEVEDYGNKWSMSAMLRYLQEAGMDTAGLMMRVEDVIIKTLLCGVLHISTACRMYQHHRGNCFELYGFDILIDESLQPWVLEVNLSPSLTCDAPLDLRLKSNLVASLLSLAGVVVRDPYTGEVEGRSKSTQLQSRTRRLSSGMSGMSQGLSAEEAAIVRESKEEYARRGGFVRIFPSEDSWELYGSFIEGGSSLDYILHSQLYPERVRNARPVAPANLSSIIAKRLQKVSRDTTTELGGDSPVGLSALKRVAVYIRKLENKTPRLSKAETKLHADLHTVEKTSAVHPSTSSTSTAIPTATTQPGSLQEEIAHHIVDNAALLSKFEARQVFALYLEHVKNRLIRETSVHTPHPVGSCTSEKDQTSVDLVTHFLKKAASNLKTPFTIVVPNHRLPLRDRRRILAKQLAEFISLYRKVTSELERATDGRTTGYSCSFSPEMLKAFLQQASEEDLEKLLAAYAKQTKSSAFFGSVQDAIPKMAPSPTHHCHTAPSSSQPHTTPSYTTPSYTTPSHTTPSHTTPSYATPQSSSNSQRWYDSEETVQHTNTLVAVPQARHASSSQVPQRYMHKPAGVPKYAWASDLPQTSSLSATCLNSAKSSVWSSSLPTSYQKSLELLTESLARWNSSSNMMDPRNRRSTSAEPERRKPPSAGSSKLKRSPSVESVVSITTATTSDASQKLNQSRRLSGGSLQWFQSSARPNPAIASATKSYSNPYAQPVCTKKQAKAKSNVPPPPLHPTLSKESISQALQRLTQKQNARRHASSSGPRGPLLAQFEASQKSSIPQNPGKDMTGNPRPSQSLEHITSQGDGQKPLLPCPHYASASAERTDLQLRIQSHNQAIAHQMSVHCHVSHSPHMSNSELL